MALNFLGYVPESASVITCGSNGKWNIESTSCVLAKCDKLPVISHATLTYRPKQDQRTPSKLSIGESIGMCDLILFELEIFKYI